MKRIPRWPVGITVLLVAFAAGNIQMMRIAASDPSFAVEPDYYQKAVRFDSTLAQERSNHELGWTATSRIERVPGSGRVAVTIVDRAGTPVTDARVRVDARFNARAAEILTAELVESRPGTYEAPLDVKYGGEWEVRLDAVRGGAHYTASTRTQAPPFP